jgi:hypothetical protein
MSSTISQRALEAAEAARKCYKNGDYHGADAHHAIMNDEWNAILAKYPTLFTGPNIGLGAGVGWWPALEACFADITAVLIAYPGLDFNAVQIKEKFGGLRFYYDLYRAEGSELTEEQETEARGKIYEAVEKAEQVAAVACEVCGQPGKRRNGSWIRTLCDEHAKEK